MRSSDFVNHSYDYRPNSNPLVLLPLLIIIIIVVVIIIIIIIIMLEGERGKSLQVTWLNDYCDTSHTNLACSVPFFSIRSSRLSTLH